MSEQKHTPTPWKTDEGVEGFPDILSSSDKSIIGCEGFYNDFDEDWANAAHIVKCVNCHDDLLEALKQITQHYCQLIESGDCGFWDPETDSCVIKARYYISQSEGKPQ